MEIAEPGGEIVPSAVTRPAGGGLTPLAAQAAAGAMPDSTRRSYEASWREFAAWCETQDRTPMPASAATLASWTAHLCHERPVLDRGGLPTGQTGLSPATVRLKIAAVVAAHHLADAPAPGPRAARDIIKGYARDLAAAHDPRARPRRADPFNRENLAALTGAGLRGAQEAIRLRDTAVMYLDFGAATRVSELAALNVEDVTSTPDAYLVGVYRGKTRKFTDVRISRTDSPVTCRALEGWLAFLAAQGITSGPLFPRIGRYGELGAVHPDGGRMTTRSIARRIVIARDEAGLGDLMLTPHSGRRGFVTEAVLAGHGLIAIENHGGWSPGSTSVKGYFDEASQIRLNPLRGAGI